MLGTTEGETSDAGGELVLHVPALSAEAFFAESALTVSRPARPALRVACRRPDRAHTRLRAHPGPARQRRVRRPPATGGWRRLAVDDSPPYRAFLDPKSFRRKETVHLVAIARALDGTTAVSAVVPTIVRR